MSEMGLFRSCESTASPQSMMNISVYPFEATLSGSPQDEGEEGCTRVSLSSLFNMEHKKCHLSLKGQCCIDHHLWLDPQMGQCLTKAKKINRNAFLHKGFSKERISPQNLNLATSGFRSKMVTKEPVSGFSEFGRYSAHFCVYTLSWNTATYSSVTNVI